MAWKTAAELPPALQSPLSLRWSENPLRHAFTNLARSQRVAIWIDRRLDPERKLTFSADDQPLAVVLERLGLALSCGYARVGPVIYFGPQETAARVATVAAIRRQELGEVSSLKTAFARPAPLQFAELAEPRQLAERLAAEAGLTVANPQLLPHDLWPAGDFPPLALADRLTLVLAGFDLTYSVQGQTIAWSPQPAAASYEQDYAFKGNLASAMAQVREKIPGLELRAEGGRIVARGKYENHELLARFLSGQPIRTAKVTAGEKRFTLRVDNQPAGAVVKLLAERLERRLTYAPELLDKLKERVSLDVKEVPLDELLRKTLDPLELTYQVDEQSLTIRAK